MSTTTTPANDDLLESEGWYAEVEARRRIRSKLPEAARLDRLYPSKPDPRRADYFDPDGRHSEYARNDKLREIDGIEVHDSHILVPYETVREFDVERDELDELDELVYRILSLMRVREYEAEDGIRYEIYDHSNGRPTSDVRRTDPRPVYVEAPAGHDWNWLSGMIESRRRDNRDVKGLVTARDSQTGTGKTTLAEHLCLDHDPDWNAENRATLEGDAYTDAYLELPPGSWLLGDEMEGMADNRRSMSGNNVTLTQFWSTMRAWEVSTICTLPSTTMLDKRLKELCDWRINVLERGVAVVYKTKVDDHSGEVSEKRMHRVRWGPLDDHPEHEALAEKKKEHMENFAERSYLAGDDEEDESEGITSVEDIPKPVRDALIRRFCDVGVKQAKIGAVFDLGRSTISKINTSGRTDLSDEHAVETGATSPGVEGD